MVLLTLYLISRSDFLSVKSVRVKLSNVGCATEENIKSDSNLIGKKIYLINSFKVEVDLKKKYFCIKQVLLSKRLPDNIILEIFGREPALILETGIEKFSLLSSTPSAQASSSAELTFFSEGSGERYVVDKEGVIYSKNTEQVKAPLVFIDNSNLRLGQKIDDKLVRNSIRILEKLKEYGLEIKETKIADEKILLVSSVPRIIFRLDNDIDKQIASLQLIQREAKIDSNTVEFIDLRFNKPIVKLTPKKK